MAALVVVSEKAHVHMACKGNGYGWEMYLVKVVDCVALRAHVGAWDLGNRLTRLLVAEVAANSAPQQWHSGRLAVCCVLQCAGAGASASSSSGVFWAGDSGQWTVDTGTFLPPPWLARVGAATRPRTRTRTTKVLGLSLLLVDVHRHQLAAPALLSPNTAHRPPHQRHRQCPAQAPTPALAHRRTPPNCPPPVDGSVVRTALHHHPDRRLETKRNTKMPQLIARPGRNAVRQAKKAKEIRHVKGAIIWHEKQRRAHRDARP